mmetsp:Transcript_13787/g.35423  ORF Transcript_13787/g.35423 Transcript_13787/m.35423 type:complete len:1173 (-) Transcript_13787:164-3682(-)
MAGGKELSARDTARFKRLSAMMRRKQDKSLDNMLLKNKTRHLNTVYSVVMSAALLFLLACWTFVLPITHKLQFGWPLHMVAIFLWSSTSDLDYDDFFAQRPWLNFASGLVVTLSLSQLVIFNRATLPCAGDDDTRSVLAFLAWGPAIYAAASGTLRSIVAAIFGGKTPHITTFCIHVAISIMYAWLAMYLVIEHFCDPRSVAYRLKIAIQAISVLCGNFLAYRGRDIGKSSTVVFFELLHLWTFSMGVCFIIDGIANESKVYNTHPGYMVAMGVITVLVVIFMRIHPDVIRGIVSSYVRRRGAVRSALLMRHFYQGGHWAHLDTTDQEYVALAGERFYTVTVSRASGVSEPCPSSKKADFMVVCSGVLEGCSRKQAIQSVLARKTATFMQEHKRKPSYWIMDACTDRVTDMELIPQFAARCDRALVVLTPELLSMPSGLVQLYTACLVHCEASRMEIAVGGDFASIFSGSVDRALEGLTKAHVKNMLFAGGFPRQTESDAWWEEWELNSRGENLTDAKMLIRILGSLRCPLNFSRDLRRHFSGVLEYNRQLQWRRQVKDQTRHHPADFSAIVAVLADNGVIDVPNTADLPAELPREAIKLGDAIGKGQFGEVRLAKLSTEVELTGASRRIGKGTKERGVETVIDVAVKTLIDGDAISAREEFLREAAINWTFDHENVVKMFGVVTEGFPFLLVLELCSNGDLKSFLEKNSPSPLQLYGLMTGIARGMRHLAQRSFVHRDLAARNVLVDRRSTAKIADFGLGREVKDGDEYTAANRNMLLPIRWTDPAVLQDAKFSEFTDVWAFGVTCIEIWTGGEIPYRGWTVAHVVEEVTHGYRLPRPGSCPPELYNHVIASCWLPIDEDDTVKDTRPPFFEIVRRLEALVKEFHGSFERASSGETALLPAATASAQAEYIVQERQPLRQKASLYVNQDDMAARATYGPSASGGKQHGGKLLYQAAEAAPGAAPAMYVPVVQSPSAAASALYLPAEQAGAAAGLTFAQSAPAEAPNQRTALYTEMFGPPEPTIEDTRHTSPSAGAATRDSAGSVMITIPVEEVVSDSDAEAGSAEDAPVAARYSGATYVQTRAAEHLGVALYTPMAEASAVSKVDSEIPNFARRNKEQAPGGPITIVMGSAEEVVSDIDDGARSVAEVADATAIDETRSSEYSFHSVESII